MGITSLIMVLFENTIYVDWDSQLIITSCWLGLTSLFMIFQKNHIICWLGLTSSSLLHVDLDYILWSHILCELWDSKDTENLCCMALGKIFCEKLCWMGTRLISMSSNFLLFVPFRCVMDSRDQIILIFIWDLRA